MPDRQFYTQTSAVRKAALIQAGLANSLLRLFKAPFIPTAFTTRAELIAQECDFDGYTPGGYPLAAWLAPAIDPSGGATITSPLVNVAYGVPGEPPVGNVVGGGWVEDMAGTVRLVLVLDPPRAVQIPSQGFPIVLQIVEGVNVAPPEEAP